MPTFTGVFVDGADYAVVDGLTTANMFTTRAYKDYPAYGVALDGVYVSTSRSGVNVNPHDGTFTGVEARDFGNDWYYRVHIIPTAVDLGNLVSAQERTISLWNAYLTPQSYTDIDLVGFDGLTLVPPAGVNPPTTIAELRLVTYGLQVSLDGPPTITASVTFTVGGIEYTAPITGRRVVLMPFGPNWDSGVEDTLLYRSTVSRSWDGTEQRASLRAKPRRRLNYTSVLRKNDAMRFDNLMYGWHSRLFAVPLWAEKSSLQANVAAGATTLTVDTSNKSFAEGGLLIVYGSTTENDVAEIETIVGTTVTLRAPVTRDWAAGTRVYPAVVAALSQEVSGRRLTDAVTEVALSFETEPGSNYYPFVGGSNPLTYKNEELYAHYPNWKDGIEFSWESDRIQVDDQTGKFQLVPKAANSTVTKQHNWTLRNHGEVADFRQWAQRRQGRAKPVYVPTGIVDFTLTAPALAADVAIDVEDNGYNAFASATAARRDILIQLKNGTNIARRINSSLPNPDGTVSLQLDSAVGVPFAPEDVKRVSLLGFYRLASDSMTIRWLAEGVAEVEAAFVATKT